MSDLITHQLLDQYESVSGELEKLPLNDRPDGALWDLLDELMLDLHLINHALCQGGLYQTFGPEAIGSLCG